MDISTFIRFNDQTIELQVYNLSNVQDRFLWVYDWGIFPYVWRSGLAQVQVTVDIDVDVDDVGDDIIHHFWLATWRKYQQAIKPTKRKEFPKSIHSFISTKGMIITIFEC